VLQVDWDLVVVETVEAEEKVVFDLYAISKRVFLRHQIGKSNLFH
jgi:hypothetical protein